MKSNTDKIQGLVNMSDEEFEEIYSETMMGRNEKRDEEAGTSHEINENNEHSDEHEDFVDNNPTQGLRFDDLKSAFKKFHGDNKSNISTWIKHFEEQCNMFKMSTTRKFIFAKRMMEGPAKLFIEYESTATSWNLLKNELLKEFGNPINSVLTHQKMSIRKKSLLKVISSICMK